MQDQDLKAGEDATSSLKQDDTEANPTLVAAREIGAFLRLERERAGLSVSEVSAVMKLSPRIIELLELGDLHALPSVSFVSGYIGSYARLLNLDLKEHESALKQITAVKPTLSVEPFNPKTYPKLDRMISLSNGAEATSSFPLILKVILGLGISVFALYLIYLVIDMLASPDSAVKTDPSEPQSISIQGTIPLPTSQPSASTQKLTQPATLTQNTQPPSARPEIKIDFADLSHIAQAQTITPPESPAIDNLTLSTLPSTPTLTSTPQGAQISEPQATPPQKTQTPLEPQPTITPPGTPDNQSAALSNNPKVTLRLAVDANAQSWISVRDKNDAVVLETLLESASHPLVQTQVTQAQFPLTIKIGNGKDTHLFFKGEEIQHHPRKTSGISDVTLNFDGTTPE